MPSSPVLPGGVDWEDLLRCLRHLSWGAADILLAYARGEKPPFGFPRALNVRDGGEGPVSAADLAVNHFLLDGLKSQYPSANWELLSEETSKDQLIEDSPIDSEWLWVLDPLDGTKDFLQGTGEYAVHLALVKGNTPLLGVVLLPEVEELWFGLVGFGAWCEDRLGRKSPVRFSQRSKIQDLIIVASRNHRDSRLEELLSSLSLAGSKTIGSVGCKIATILRGEADLYVSLSGISAPKDWDMAAPQAVLLAAGGRFTHADGQELTYNTGDIRQKGCLIASHGKAHDQLCKEVLKKIKLIDPQFEV